MEDAEELSFEIENEPWSVYRLEDGTVLRLHPVMVNVCRLLDRVKPNGEPIYVYQYAMVPRLDLSESPAKPKAAGTRKKARKKKAVKRG